jgi:hypothetical protein
MMHILPVCPAPEAGTALLGLRAIVAFNPGYYAVFHMKP